MSDLPKKTRGRPRKEKTFVGTLNETNVYPVLKQVINLYEGANKPQYELSVSIGDFLVNTETDNVVDALLDIKPAKINQKVIISLSKGDLFVTKQIFPLKAKMIFARRLSAEFFVKRLLLSMK